MQVDILQIFVYIPCYVVLDLLNLSLFWDENNSIKPIISKEVT